MQIFDNVRSIVKDDLEQTIAKSSRLSIAAATFSIYAYQELRKQLEGIDELRFIFTSQTFTTEQARKERREFYIPRLSRERSLYGSEFEIKLRNELSQKAIAKECADWIRRKVSFRSNVTDESMNSFISIQEGSGEVHTYQPINGFTTTDLGVGRGNNATNIVVRLDSPATDEFLRMFDTIWGDSARLQDVTDVVLDNITAAVHTFLRILGAVDHGEDHAVRAALQNGLDVGGLVIRHAHERAASASVGGHDGVLDHGLGHARMLVVDPDIVVAQQPAHLVEIHVGGGAVGAKVQLAGDEIFADSCNVVHKKCSLEEF